MFALSARHVEDRLSQKIYMFTFLCWLLLDMVSVLFILACRDAGMFLSAHTFMCS